MLPLLAFDLDGTLIDSAQDITTALNFVFTSYQKPILQKCEVIPYIGNGPRQLINQTFSSENLDHAMINELYQLFIDTYYQVMLETTSLYPGVFDFLNQYKGPIGIITNKPIQPTRKILKHLGIDHFPWIDIYGADSLSEKKPSPLPLKTMMKKANREPRASMMIGDGIPDMESGLNAGAKIIAVSYGYSELDLLEKYQPNQILHQFKDLSTILEKMS